MFFLTKTVEIRWNWWCKIFSLKIRRCKFLDKFHVWLLRPRGSGNRNLLPSFPNSSKLLSSSGGGFGNVDQLKIFLAKCTMWKSRSLKKSKEYLNRPRVVGSKNIASDSYVVVCNSNNIGFHTIRSKTLRRSNSSKVRPLSRNHSANKQAKCIPGEKLDII